MNQKLGDLAEISLGFAIQKSVELDLDGNVRIVRPSNGNDHRSIDWACVQRMNLPEKKIRRPLQEGDLLFKPIGNEHPVFIVAKVPEGPPALAHQHFILIRPGKELNSRFLWLLLNEPLVQQRIAALSTGKAKKVVNVTALRDLHVPVFPISEQTRWVEEWRQQSSLAEQLRLEADRLDEGFTFALGSLLKGGVG